MDVMERGLKAQFKYADRIGARFVAVIGDEELAKGVVALRDMRASTQVEVPKQDAADTIKTRII